MIELLEYAESEASLAQDNIELLRVKLSPGGTKSCYLANAMFEDNGDPKLVDKLELESIDDKSTDEHSKSQNYLEQTQSQFQYYTLESQAYLQNSVFDSSQIDVIPFNVAYTQDYLLSPHVYGISERTNNNLTSSPIPVAVSPVTTNPVTTSPGKSSAETSPVKTSPVKTSPAKKSPTKKSPAKENLSEEQVESNKRDDTLVDTIEIVKDHCHTVDTEDPLDLSKWPPQIWPRITTLYPLPTPASILTFLSASARPVVVCLTDNPGRGLSDDLPLQATLRLAATMRVPAMVVVRHLLHRYSMLLYYLCVLHRL